MINIQYTFHLEENVKYQRDINWHFSTSVQYIHCLRVIWVLCFPVKSQ